MAHRTGLSGRGATIIGWPLLRRPSSAAPPAGRGQDFDGLRLNGQARLREVRKYAITVFGSAELADAWLRRPNGAVLRGSAAVREACQCLDGFRQAMFELFRLKWRERAFNM